MTKQEKRKGGGAKTSRSETVTVRLDPQVRYMAELAARSQRRTLSSFIDWAIEESFKESVQFTSKDGETRSANEARPALWDTNEVDRFIRLAMWYPSLLTHDEQKLWKLVRELWTIFNPPPSGFLVESLFTIEDVETLRRHWPYLKDAAQAGTDATAAAAAIRASSEVAPGTQAPVKAAAKKSRKAA